MSEEQSLDHYDTLTLAVERLRYVDALYTSMIDALSQASRRCPRVYQAEALARLGRYNIEEWLSQFESDQDSAR